jgi:hypothetical protein
VEAVLVLELERKAKKALTSNVLLVIGELIL